MNLHSVLRVASVLSAMACLVLADVMIGDWLVVLAIPVMLLFWILMSRRSAFWAGSALLGIYVTVAVVGVARQAPAFLMATGCMFALAAWEMSDPRGNVPGQTPAGYGAALEQRRLQSLVVVVCAAIVLAAAPSVLRVRLPFGIVALLALVLMGCVLYALHHLRNNAG